ncbi:MAG: hypothetical protein EOR11_23470 [Mesorhizobium sp.]|uniref:hypothetical protein n=1 Tax=Mesorhizobium sp. TaxID=1871066 RepID=UPI000FEA1D74|nr:hypothetical protein [Mesorhizobium sp.]RWP83480.1 MAG: hypothetical protein EOR11_23470 [Mesorhizobium sp.]
MAKGVEAQELFDSLLRADTETEVVTLLKNAGYWDDPTAWRFYGDQPENWATVGGQQSRAEQALIEKLMNSIDTKLIAAARMAGLPINGAAAPQSVFDARNLLFGEELKNVEKLSQSITVAATGKRGRPSITIVDDGEGQTPQGMPKTILSLHKGNKNSIPFVQGKFNMGGSGVLEFCGVEHNVELVLSKRNPELVPVGADPEDSLWSFTIIRREDPSPASPRASRFTYLAPAGEPDAQGNRGLLTFQAPSLPIFPVKNEPYAREATWGTLFKLYEYAVRASTNMMLEGGLLGRVRILLPEPALPVHFHECRNYSGHSGSYSTTMAGLIHTLEEDRKSPKRQNVEWFDKFEINLDGETFTGRIYLFRKRAKDEKKNPADNYRKDEGVVFTFNGQCHAFFSKDFFRRRAVKQDYLWDSLLVFVDASAISVRAHEKLFMPTRENLRHGDLKFRLEQELEEKLKNHKELLHLANARRKSELSDNPEVSATFEKFIEDMVKKHPLLEQILGTGFRIANPFKPHSVEVVEKPWEGARFPTKFHFKDRIPGAELQRDSNINSQTRIAFVTDVENDYFRRDEDPGEFKLFQVTGEGLVPAKNWRTPHLFEGNATLSLSLPPDAAIGDRLTFEAQIMDPSRIEPFRNRFALVVQAERGETPLRQNPPKPKPDVPGEQPGKNAQNDTKLNVPTPVDVWEKDWANQDPPFGKFTAMRIKRQPGAEEGTALFDYTINMNNIFIDQAVKARPKRMNEYRDRYKFGMTLITLALIRHDLEVRKHFPERHDDEEETKRPDLHDTVEDVTSALAPFLLPLVDTLSQITGELEPLSAIAGEAA